MCDSDLGPGPVTEAAGECLAMAQLGGLHRPISIGCVRVETNGWLQIYTKVKEKRGWQKRWCELQSGFIMACGKTPQSALRPRIDLTKCKSLAPSHTPGAKKGELALSCASGTKRLHGVTEDGQRRWVRALITSLTVLRCQDSLQSEALRPTFAQRTDLIDPKHGDIDETARYARLGAIGVRRPTLLLAVLIQIVKLSSPDARLCCTVEHVLTHRSPCTEQVLALGLTRLGLTHDSEGNEQAEHWLEIARMLPSHSEVRTVSLFS